MHKALWAAVVTATVALGISIFGTVINDNDARSDSVTVSAVVHQESVDRAEIAQLRAEVQALSAAHSRSP